MSSRPVLRRCVACRQLFDRAQLWRVVRLSTGGVQLDGGQGRSAYLCRHATCLESALRHKRLQRALRCQVAESILKCLETRLAGDDPACSEAR